MEPIVFLFLAGIAMSLLSIPIMALYTILEDGERKNEIKRYARRQIMKQMDREKQMNGALNEKVDLLGEYQ